MNELRVQTYQEFRNQYELEHPASVPTMEVYIGEYAPWVTWAVGAMFVTAAFFSGVHTVPVAHEAIDAGKVAEWLRQLGGISAFLFIEMGILTSAYFLVKKFSIVKLVILLIAGIVAMGANLYSVEQAFASNTVDTFTKVITLLFGLVAPLMAGLSGGVFVELHQSDRTADARSQNKFRQQQIEWDNEIQREWKKVQRTGGQVSYRPRLSDAMSAHRPPDNRTDSLADGHTGQADEIADRRHATGQGYTKKPDARQVVRDYLATNPAQVTGNVRQIAEALNVGKSTVSEVQQEFRRTASESDTEPVNTVQA
jgi:hypothetical protein